MDTTAGAGGFEVMHWLGVVYILAAGLCVALGSALMGAGVALMSALIGFSP